MANDYVIEQQEAEFEEEAENTIQLWIANGADPIDARQLWDDMINDPYNSDPDMDCHFDPTIDDRIEMYSSKS